VYCGRCYVLVVSTRGVGLCLQSPSVGLLLSAVARWALLLAVVLYLSINQGLLLQGANITPSRP
jgi:hypothetical protein